MRRASHAELIAFVFCATLGVARPSLAQSAGAPEEAKQEFEQGADLEKKGDFAGALAHFRRAAQLKPTAGVRFHEGYCLEMTGKLAQALDVYEAAEALAREQNKASVLSAVRARLEPLSPRVPQIVVRVVPKDAQLTIDGAPAAAGVAEGKPTRIDPGEHVVAAQAPGRAPKEVRVTAKEGATEEVAIALEAAPPPATASAPPPPAATTEPPPEPAPKRSLTAPLLVTGGAVAFLAGGLTAFFLAGGAQSDAERECPTKVSCQSEQNQVRTLDALALTGFIGAAGLGALAVVMFTSGGTRVQTSGTSVSVSGAF